MAKYQIKAALLAPSGNYDETTAQRQLLISRLLIWLVNPMTLILWHLSFPIMRLRMVPLKNTIAIPTLLCTAMQMATTSWRKSESNK